MESFHFHRRTALKNVSTGFTLVELLIAFSIMVVIMSIVLTSQSSFNKTLILANTAYDVALSLHSAENFGLGGRVTRAGVINAGYGIHFQGTPSSAYTLFADSNLPNASNCHGLPPSGDVAAPDAQFGNCVYDAGEKVSDYTLNNGITINGLCVHTNNALACTDVSSLDIVFARPNAEAFMSTNGSYSAVPTVTSACITLTSPQGGSQFVSVTLAGQISASATSCL